MKTYALVFALLLAAITASAQTPTAGVTGRVTDATGAVVPGAIIRITNVATNITQQTASNASGEFVVPFLNPAGYVLEAQATGFRTYKRERFTLEVSQVLRLDIQLEVGATSETVTITDSPSVLSTETGARGEVTSSAEIAELPLDGRNFSDLALLTGGVIPKGDGGDGSFAVNGARGDNAGFLLDGMNNTQRRNTNVVINPPIESIQEFKMMTSGYSAEYGRYAGGMLSAVTKSGTNKLHGSLYEFIRNDVFDAKGYFDPERLKLRRHQFGATTSGPVLIPKIYDGRNRTFFMFTWESFRQTDGEAERALTPTPEMLRGDFSKVTDAAGKPIVLTDTVNRVPFANNQIPLNRLDPVALKLAQYFPKPNLSGGPFNFITQGNNRSTYDSFGVKIDHTMFGADRLTGGAFWRRRTAFDPVNTGRSPLPLFASSNTPKELLTYIRYLHTFSPTMFLESSVNFSRRTNREVWPYSADKDWAAETGFIGTTKNPIAAGPPYVTLTGYVPIGPAYDIPKIWAFNNYQATSTLTWIRGAHSFKFGVDYLRMQYFSRSYGDTRGRANFQGRFTGHPVADFVLGWADSTRRQLDAAGPYDLVSNYAGFVQDDWKVTRNLTLNLGMRYDLMNPPTEKFGAMAQFVPSLGKVVVAGIGTLPQAEFDARLTSTGLAAQVVTNEAAGLPGTIVKPDKNNFAPRFGFAYRLFGNQKTVLRGGYGIFYGSSSLYRMDDYTDTFPFSITETYSRVTADPRRLTLSAPYPTDRRAFSGVTGSYGQENDQPATQYMQSWNLALEREFGSGSVVEVAYSGSKGTHLQRRYDLNQAGRTQATSTIRPYPAFGSIQIINDGSNSIYNSGQLTVRRRLSKQLFLRGSYTYAKSIDESSNTGGTIAYNFSQAQDSRNLKLERGRSDFDIGHTFAGSFIWSPNLGRNWLARDWQLSGTSTIYSGAPFTPRVATVSFVNGEATRPDRIASGKLDNPTVDRWFDVSAFRVVPTGSYRFGNSGRNILDGPGTVIINTSLSRRFRFSEGKAIQYRVEAFNLPNHPNFNLPENNVDTPTVGTIKRAKNSRNLQMSLRLEF
ncbi:MAG: carboxypeptidase regulatory-like domain-containing protein [Blastocatellia bacterium]